MNYIELFDKHTIISKLPLKVGSKELTSSMKAKVLLMKVQYNCIIESFEKEMQEALNELKKDYPEFDKQAADIEKMRHIDEKMKAYKEYKGEKESKPSKPSEEELKEAEKIRETETEFNNANKKLTKEYIDIRMEKLKEEVSLKEKKFSFDEYTSIIELIGDTEVEINGQKLPAENFLSMIGSLFVE